MIQVHVSVKPAGGSKLDKQVTFATALALTQTAKDAQGAVIGDIESTFTVRNNWDKPSNKFGIRITPATKDHLTSVVRTDADWLNLHEEGGIKIPEGHFIAIPTSNVRRTKKQIVQKGQRPKALFGKRDFLILTKKNRRPVLFQRFGRGKRSDIKAMYVLVPRGQIKRESTVFDPVQKTVERVFGQNFSKALQRAIATAK
jgi:hypothetical protein